MIKIKIEDEIISELVKRANYPSDEGRPRLDNVGRVKQILG